VHTYRLTLEYDGTGFQGWQSQGRDDRRTVQDTLQAALDRVCQEAGRVTASGRTDAGVHAEGQVASARLRTGLAPAELARGLNAVLPRDLAVVEVALADDHFHARRDARSKAYRYAVWNGPTRSPARDRSHTMHPNRRLDLEAMRAAAKLVLGEHDFAAFQAAGSSVQTTVRTLTRLDVEGAAGAEVHFWVEGSGFLRHMVRNLVGTLLEIGLGRRAPDEMAAILASRDRARAGPTAPARGLTLVRVDY
jgi:tRNA pseudouridine38-40 synthase